MQTLKTALVVTILLAVLYGVYVTLNKPDSTVSDAPGADEFNLDVQLSEDSGSTMPEFSPESLGEASSGPPQFSQTDGSDFPLPSFGTTGDSQGSPTEAEVAGAYANEVTAPPLSSGGSYPTPQHSEHDHAGHDHEHEHDHVQADHASPSKYEETATTDSSPYANARTENVSADNFTPSENDSQAANQPYQGSLQDGSTEEADSRAALAEYRFKQKWGEAQAQLDDNKFARALATLTSLYREPDLAPESRQQLLDMLDRLAGTVIYSTEHRLEPPYEVARGETLDQIAAQFQVPGELLMNINRGSINEPDLLLPGTQLKVMRGPFRAEIEIKRNDPSRGEATLFLGTLYAGRFPLTLGDDLPTPGQTYQVVERLEGKPFYQPAGPPLEARSPTNPYGLHWLGFNSSPLGIHGLGRHGGEEDRRGSIRLAERDAADVYGILSVGSTVKVLE